MKQLIDKSALMAEIERLKESFVNERDDFEKGYHHGLDMVLAFLDTLETKKADLEEAINGLTCGWIEGEEYGELQNINTARCVTLEEVKEVMRCIYELGLEAQKGK